jgi:hypothetical protein
MNSIKTMSICMLAVVGITFASCKKSDTASTPTVSYQVQVVYPTSYAQTAAVGTTVTLTNGVTGTSSKAVADNAGVALFTGLLPGTYQVSAARTLTAEEALTLTGISAEVFLNAAVTSHAILQEGVLELTLSGSSVGGLVFKQVSYAGSKTPAGTNYLIDQFYEIYNNATDTLYADSLCIGDVQGNPGISSSSKASGFQSDADHVYLRNLFMVPGTGKEHPIAPGKSIIIAQTGINHKTDPTGNSNSVDLGAGIADFEVYQVSSTRDIDNPDVPNMVSIDEALSGFYWQTYVFGPSIVIFKHPTPGSLPKLLEPGTTSTATYIQVPVSNIIDGVDFMVNAGAVNFKRLPSSIDAGFQYASGTYNGQSMMRKVKSTLSNGRHILQDTNNTTEDFEVLNAPLPKGWKN